MSPTFTELEEWVAKFDAECREIESKPFQDQQRHLKLAASHLQQGRNALVKREEVFRNEQIRLKEWERFLALGPAEPLPPSIKLHARSHEELRGKTGKLTAENSEVERELTAWREQFDARAKRLEQLPGEIMNRHLGGMPVLFEQLGVRSQEVETLLDSLTHSAGVDEERLRGIRQLELAEQLRVLGEIARNAESHKSELVAIEMHGVRFADALKEIQGQLEPFMQRWVQHRQVLGEPQLRQLSEYQSQLMRDQGAFTALAGRVRTIKNRLQAIATEQSRLAEQLVKAQLGALAPALNQLRALKSGVETQLALAQEYIDQTHRTLSELAHRSAGEQHERLRHALTRLQQTGAAIERLDETQTALVDRVRDLKNGIAPLLLDDVRARLGEQQRGNVESASRESERYGTSVQSGLERRAALADRLAAARESFATLRDDLWRAQCDQLRSHYAKVEAIDKDIEQRAAKIKTLDESCRTMLAELRDQVFAQQIESLGVVQRQLGSARHELSQCEEGARQREQALGDATKTLRSVAGRAELLAADARAGEELHEIRVVQERETTSFQSTQDELAVGQTHLAARLKGMRSQLVEIADLLQKIPTELTGQELDRIGPGQHVIANAQFDVDRGLQQLGEGGRKSRQLLADIRQFSFDEQQQRLRLLSALVYESENETRRLEETLLVQSEGLKAVDEQLSHFRGAGGEGTDRGAAERPAGDRPILTPTQARLLGELVKEQSRLKSTYQSHQVKVGALRQQVTEVSEELQLLPGELAAIPLAQVPPALAVLSGECDKLQHALAGSKQEIELAGAELSDLENLELPVQLARVAQARRAIRNAGEQLASAVANRPSADRAREELDRRIAVFSPREGQLEPQFGEGQLEMLSGYRLEARRLSDTLEEHLAAIEQQLRATDELKRHLEGLPLKLVHDQFVRVSHPQSHVAEELPWVEGQLRLCTELLRRGNQALHNIRLRRFSQQQLKLQRAQQSVSQVTSELDRCASCLTEESSSLAAADKALGLLDVAAPELKLGEAERLRIDELKRTSADLWQRHETTSSRHAELKKALETIAAETERLPEELAATQLQGVASALQVVQNSQPELDKELSPCEAILESAGDTLSSVRGRTFSDQQRALRGVLRSLDECGTQLAHASKLGELQKKGVSEIEDLLSPITHRHISVGEQVEAPYLTVAQREELSRLEAIEQTTRSRHDAQAARLDAARSRYERLRADFVRAAEESVDNQLGELLPVIETARTGLDHANRCVKDFETARERAIQLVRTSERGGEAAKFISKVRRCGEAYQVSTSAAETLERGARTVQEVNGALQKAQKLLKPLLADGDEAPLLNDTQRKTLADLGAQRSEFASMVQAAGDAVTRSSALDNQLAREVREVPADLVDHELALGATLGDTIRADLAALDAGIAGVEDELREGEDSIDRLDGVPLPQQAAVFGQVAALIERQRERLAKIGMSLTAVRENLHGLAQHGVVVREAMEIVPHAVRDEQRAKVRAHDERHDESENQHRGLGGRFDRCEALLSRLEGRLSDLPKQVVQGEFSRFGARATGLEARIPQVVAQLELVGSVLESIDGIVAELSGQQYGEQLLAVRSARGRIQTAREEFTRAEELAKDFGESARRFSDDLVTVAGIEEARVASLVGGRETELSALKERGATVVGRASDAAEKVEAASARLHDAERTVQLLPRMIRDRELTRTEPQLEALAQALKAWSGSLEHFQRESGLLREQLGRVEQSSFLTQLDIAERSVDLLERATAAHREIGERERAANPLEIGAKRLVQGLRSGIEEYPLEESAQGDFTRVMELGKTVSSRYSELKADTAAAAETLLGVRNETQALPGRIVGTQIRDLLPFHRDWSEAQSAWADTERLAGTTLRDLEKLLKDLEKDSYANQVKRLSSATALVSQTDQQLAELDTGIARQREQAAESVRRLTELENGIGRAVLGIAKGQREEVATLRAAHEELTQFQKKQEQALATLSARASKCREAFGAGPGLITGAVLDTVVPVQERITQYDAARAPLIEAAESAVLDIQAHLAVRPVQEFLAQVDGYEAARKTHASGTERAKDARGKTTARGEDVDSIASVLKTLGGDGRSLVPGALSGRVDEVLALQRKHAEIAGIWSSRLETVEGALAQLEKRIAVYPEQIAQSQNEHWSAEVRVFGISQLEAGRFFARAEESFVRADALRSEINNAEFREQLKLVREVGALLDRARSSAQAGKVVAERQDARLALLQREIPVLRKTVEERLKGVESKTLQKIRALADAAVQQCESFSRQSQQLSTLGERLDVQRREIEILPQELAGRQCAQVEPLLGLITATVAQAETHLGLAAVPLELSESARRELGSRSFREQMDDLGLAEASVQQAQLELAHVEKLLAAAAADHEKAGLLVERVRVEAEECIGRDTSLAERVANLQRSHRELRDQLVSLDQELAAMRGRAATSTSELERLPDELSVQHLSKVPGVQQGVEESLPLLSAQYQAVQQLLEEIRAVRAEFGKDEGRDRFQSYNRVTRLVSQARETLAEGNRVWERNQRALEESVKLIESLSPRERNGLERLGERHVERITGLVQTGKKLSVKHGQLGTQSQELDRNLAAELTELHRQVNLALDGLVDTAAEAVDHARSNAQNLHVHVHEARRELESVRASLAPIRGYDVKRRQDLLREVGAQLSQVGTRIDELDRLVSAQGDALRESARIQQNLALFEKKGPDEIVRIVRERTPRLEELRVAVIEIEKDYENRVAHARAARVELNRFNEQLVRVPIELGRAELESVDERLTELQQTLTELESRLHAGDKGVGEIEKRGDLLAPLEAAPLVAEVQVARSSWNQITSELEESGRAIEKVGRALSDQQELLALYRQGGAGVDAPLIPALAEPANGLWSRLQELVERRDRVEKGLGGARSRLDKAAKVLLAVPRTRLESTLKEISSGMEGAAGEQSRIDDALAKLEREIGEFSKRVPWGATASLVEAAKVKHEAALFSQRGTELAAAVSALSRLGTHLADRMREADALASVGTSDEREQVQRLRGEVAQTLGAAKSFTQRMGVLERETAVTFTRGEREPLEFVMRRTQEVRQVCQELRLAVPVVDAQLGLIEIMLRHASLAVSAREADGSVEGSEDRAKRLSDERARVDEVAGEIREVAELLGRQSAQHEELTGKLSRLERDLAQEFPGLWEHHAQVVRELTVQLAEFGTHRQVHETRLEKNRRNHEELHARLSALQGEALLRVIAGLPERLTTLLDRERVLAERMGDVASKLSEELIALKKLPLKKEGEKETGKKSKKSAARAAVGAQVARAARGRVAKVLDQAETLLEEPRSLDEESVETQRQIGTMRALSPGEPAESEKRQDARATEAVRRLAKELGEVRAVRESRAAEVVKARGQLLALWEEMIREAASAELERSGDSWQKAYREFDALDRRITQTNEAVRTLLRRLEGPGTGKDGENESLVDCFEFLKKAGSELDSRHDEIRAAKKELDAQKEILAGFDGGAQAVASLGFSGMEGEVWSRLVALASETGEASKRASDRLAELSELAGAREKAGGLVETYPRRVVEGILNRIDQSLARSIETAREMLGSTQRVVRALHADVEALSEAIASGVTIESVVPLSSRLDRKDAARDQLAEIMGSFRHAEAESAKCGAELATFEETCREWSYKVTRSERELLERVRGREAELNRALGPIGEGLGRGELLLESLDGLWAQICAAIAQRFDVEVGGLLESLVAVREKNGAAIAQMRERIAKVKARIEAVEQASEKNVMRAAEELERECAALAEESSVSRTPDQSEGAQLSECRERTKALQTGLGALNFPPTKQLADHVRSAKAAIENLAQIAERELKEFGEIDDEARSLGESVRALPEQILSVQFGQAVSAAEEARLAQEELERRGAEAQGMLRQITTALMGIRVRSFPEQEAILRDTKDRLAKATGEHTVLLTEIQAQNARLARVGDRLDLLDAAGPGMRGSLSEEERAQAGELRGHVKGLAQSAKDALERIEQAQGRVATLHEDHARAEQALNEARRRRGSIESGPADTTVAS